MPLPLMRLTTGRRLIGAIFAVVAFGIAGGAFALTIITEANYNFGGAWRTSEGAMTIRQSGLTFTATYGDDNGRIEGSVSGDRATGFWAETSSARRCDTQRFGSYYWGRFVWTMRPDADHFEGTYSYCDAQPSGAWTGDRTGPPQNNTPRPPGNTPPPANDGPAANYDGAWRTTEGAMTIRQSGSAFTAAYGNDNGRIEATVQGAMANGYWGENSSQERCSVQRLGTFYWGRVTWALRPDGQRFEGTYSHCDGPAAGTWTGDRTGPAQNTRPPQTQPPAPTPAPGPRPPPAPPVTNAPAYMIIDIVEGPWRAVWTQRVQNGPFEGVWRNTQTGEEVRDTLILEARYGQLFVFYRQGRGGRYYAALNQDGRSFAGVGSWYQLGESLTGRTR